MAPTVQSAFNNFFGSVTATGASLANAFLAFFTAFFAFAQSVLAAIIQFSLSVVQLGVDLFQGAAGFFFANFFILTILGGGYYWWATRGQGQKGSSIVGRK